MRREIDKLYKTFAVLFILIFKYMAKKPSKSDKLDFLQNAIIEEGQEQSTIEREARNEALRKKALQEKVDELTLIREGEVEYKKALGETKASAEKYGKKISGDTTKSDDIFNRTTQMSADLMKKKGVEEAVMDEAMQENLEIACDKLWEECPKLSELAIFKSCSFSTLPDEGVFKINLDVEATDAYIEKLKQMARVFSRSDNDIPKHYFGMLISDEIHDAMPKIMRKYLGDKFFETNESKNRYGFRTYLIMNIHAEGVGEATESLRINSEAFGEVRKDVDKFRNETSEISIVLEELLDELKMKREKFLKCLAEFNERYPLFGYGYFNENIDIIIKKAEKRLSEES